MYVVGAVDAYDSRQHHRQCSSEFPSTLQTNKSIYPPFSSLVAWLKQVTQEGARLFGEVEAWGGVVLLIVTSTTIITIIIIPTAVWSVKPWHK